MKKFQAYLLIAVVAIFCLASGTVAQTVQGVITGFITDPSGASVPNATVTITNAGTNIAQSTTTGSDGSYRFSLVPPGQYVIDIKATSFAEMKVSGIVVEASQTVPFNAKLELAKGSEVIEVTEQAVLVQTANSELSFQVDRSTIENTPLVDRDVFASLPFLAAQVTPGLDLAPTSGGARESGTSYLLNGADDNDNFSGGGVNIHPPLESVQDFAILTNSMSAEYGRGFGAVVTANQKAGANRFHGVVYEFNRNASLNANDFFYNQNYLDSIGTADQLPAKPKYIRNQFGGEVDGPIKKDKTFFSFAYDRIKLLAGSSSANNYVPTTAGLALAESTVGPVGQAAIAAFKPLTSDAQCDPGSNTPTYSDGTPSTGPGINPSGLPNSVGCVGFFDPQTDTEDSYYGRLDQNFSANDRLSVTFNYYRQTFDDKYGGGGLTTGAPISAVTLNHYHNITLNETHTFNPRVVNEFLIAQNRHYNTGLEGSGSNTVPEMYVDNYQAGCLNYVFGPYSEYQVTGFVQDRWQARDNIDITKGRHSIKIGGGGQYGILYRNWDLGGPGYYEFSELNNTNNSATPGRNAACAAGALLTPTCDGTLQADGSIAGITGDYFDNSSFGGDYPYYQELAINPATGAKADAYRHYTYHDYYLFVQDDWKVSSRLTLNLGLRWDRYGAPTEASGILAQFDNTGCNILTASCLNSLRMGPVARMWPTPNKDFGPRFGFAWDPMGKGRMAIRGGYGIYYDRIFDNIWSNSAWNPPFYALLDSNATGTASVYYSNPTSTGTSYVPNSIPNPSYPLSLRSMDQAMQDASGQNYFFSAERQVLGSFLFRAGYQGSLGRHLPMLENLNRVDGSAANASLTFHQPNPLYNGFNYRSDSVNSSYNAMVLEAQKKMSNGLSYTVGYTWSKLLDVNSELFAACSTLGSYSAPYYYVDNAQPNLYRGPASYNHKNAFKFNVIYQEPFFKDGKGIAGYALGGWTISSFFQYYTGSPIDVYSGASVKIARDAMGNAVLDQNGLPYNLGGDFNLDGTKNDHPDFVGSSVSAAYSGGDPTQGIFKDNSKIGCNPAGLPATVVNCTNPGNSLFVNPAYATSGPSYDRFGDLGRGVFHGPGFAQMDAGISKSFRVRESMKLDFKAQAENVLNHPSFNCVQSNLNSVNFGKALCLTQSVNGLGAPTARIMSLGLRLSF